MYSVQSPTRARSRRKSIESDHMTQKLLSDWSNYLSVGRVWSRIMTIEIFEPIKNRQNILTVINAGLKQMREKDVWSFLDPAQAQY